MGSRGFSFLERASELIRTKFSKSLIRLYSDFNRELFPLCQETNASGKSLPIKQQGKQPLHKHWRTRSYSRSELLEYVGRGHNLGWKLGPDDIVIDVDPRNNGFEGLENLVENFGLDDLADVAPAVITGGGGRHYYFKKPQGAPEKLKAKLKQYEGVDFKKLGGYVVTAGSYHYQNDDVYHWDEMSPFDIPAPDLPEWLVLELMYKSSTESNFSGEADYSPEQLKEILDQIPVEEYDSNDTWFPMLLASHYATAGQGLDVFLDWSLGDSKYSGHEDLIETRWNSVHNQVESMRTTATLLHELNVHGGTAPGREPKQSATEEFVEYIDQGTGDLYDGIDRIQKAQITTEPTTAAVKLRDRIDSLSKKSTSRDVNNVLKRCLDLGPIALDIVFRDVQGRTGLSRAAIRGQYDMLVRARREKEAQGGETGVSLTEADVRDLIQQITAVLIREKYSDGRHIMYLDDGQYWYYDGRKWVPYFDGLVDRDIYEAALTLRSESPDIDFTVSTILPQVQRILRAKTATNLQLFDFRRGRPSVVNLADCELWITPTDGRIKKRPHRAESLLTQCLDHIEFDPKAECPLFDRTLKDIFSKEEQRDEIIRHLWEVLGYIIQPKKNIASWFLFYGTGANGKTLLLEVLSALLGEASLEQPITDFNPGGSKHARASLPGRLALIDDDVSANTVLPDEFLKKLSENKTLVAEPKFRPVIKFRSTATVILATNTLPSVRDLSDGMLRRANLFPFRRKFTRFERDYDRAAKIIETELPGILVGALRGLQRLRRRGDFDIPETCSLLKNNWIDEASPITSFIKEKCLTGSVQYTTNLKTLWNIYDVWAMDNGIESRYRLTLRRFATSLVDLGFERYKGPKGARHFRGITVRPSIHDVDGIFGGL